MEIDNGAPVISRETIEIQAPIHTVWRVHTDVRAWATWQADIDEASTEDDELRPGSQFTWRTTGLTITSTVDEVIEPTLISWGGPAHGIEGRHVWEFSAKGAATIVNTRESWSGAGVDADPAAMQIALDKSLQTWLLQLKQRAEVI